MPIRSGATESSESVVQPAPAAAEDGGAPSGTSLSARIERYAAAYWRERFEAEARNGPLEGVADRVVFVPFDRAKLPPRNPAAPSQSLDLTDHYTDTLDGTNLSYYENDDDNDLRELPRGVQRFGEVTFDLRGLIRLQGFYPPTGRGAVLHRSFPERTGAIQVGRAVARLHVLGGVTSRNQPGTGAVVMRLVWRYADGTERESLVRYGQHLRNWWSFWDSKADVTDGRVAWTGSSPTTAVVGGQIRLYHFALANPRPDLPVESVHCMGGQATTPPFIVAMTLE